MSDGFVRRFFKNFNKIPEEKPPLVPERWRVPFFAALSVVALVLLLLLLWLVVLPGIRAQQASSAVPPLPRLARTTSEECR